MGKKIVVLHSGGLDSTVMWKMAKELDESNEVIAVYFDIGHDYAWKEKEKLPIGAIIHDMTWFQAWTRRRCLRWSNWARFPRGAGLFSPTFPRASWTRSWLG